VASNTSIRLWRAHKASGRPWPTLDDDEVIDYFILEAIAAKVAKDDERQRKALEKNNWKNDKSKLLQATNQ
jgi:hypothetical protein